MGLLRFAGALVGAFALAMVAGVAWYAWGRTVLPGMGLDVPTYWAFTWGTWWLLSPLSVSLGLCWAVTGGIPSWRRGRRW